MSSLKQIFKEVSKIIPEADVSAKILSKIILKHNKIIGLGAGRMGYSIKAFMMRLAHLGLDSFFYGDTTLPRTGKKDLLIVNSSSGKTPSLVPLIIKAKEYDMTIASITTDENSIIGQLSDYVIHINKIKATKQIMKTCYEQATYLLFDITAEMIKKGLPNIKPEDLHSILE